MERPDGRRFRWPLLGQLPGFLRNPLGTLDESRRRGDCTELDLGFARIMALHHPRHADHVLRQRQTNYAKDGPFWDRIRDLMGKGLPGSRGDVWLRHRRLMQPQFLRKRIATLSPLVIAAIDRSLRWADVTDDWTTIDIGGRMPHLTMNVVSASMLGHRTSREAAAVVKRELDFALVHMFRAMLANALPRFVPVPGRRRFARAVATLQRVLDETIAIRRRSGHVADDLLSGLIAATDSTTGVRLSPIELRDEVLSLFLAGYETTSSGLSWALYFLSEHPDLLDTLRAQVGSALSGRAPTFEDLPQLQMFRWVMMEALRINPPAWWLPRVAVEADEIDGHRIAPGTMVAPCIYTIHRHPELWPNPERFDPMRHAPARAQGRHPLAWLPFGAGPRRCIGQELSLMESTFALAMLVQRYEFESIGHRTTPKFSTVIRPGGGVRVRIRRRPSACDPRPLSEAEHASDSNVFVL